MCVLFVGPDVIRQGRVSIPAYPVIQPLGAVDIVRGDAIEGGIKRIFLHRMLDIIPDPSFSYAGTAFGHGALALALACRDAGKKAYLYIAAPIGHHPMIQRLEESGATVVPVAGTTVSELYHRAVSEGRGHVLPPGFDMPAFRDAAVESVRLMPALTKYSEIWTSAVSGTLTRALQHAMPDRDFHVVCAVKNIAQLQNVRIYTAPEKYYQPARLPPPYPACAYTDAKVWQFASIKASPGALIWNTAG